MRLPWPFSRQQPAAATPQTGDVFAARPRGAQAWRQLPVLRTSFGEPPLIAPTPPFRAKLAGAATAPIALAPLTHAHGIHAPAGLARNVARAIAPGQDALALDRDARAALMPTRRRQRSEEGPDVSFENDSAPPPAAPLSPAAAAPGIPAGPLKKAVVSAPVAEPARSFVRADRQGALPALPMGRVGAARPAVAVQRAAAQPSPAAELAPPPATHSTEPRPVTGPAAAQAAGSPERLTLGQSRRVGLGAPIDPTALAITKTRAAPDSPDAPDREPDLPLNLRTVASAAPDAAPAPAPSEGPASAGSTAPSPALAAPASPAPAVSAAPVLAAPIRQRATQMPSGPQAPKPLVGARPASAHVQRAPSVVSVASAQPSRAPAPSKPSSVAEPVRVKRGSKASSLAGALDARAFTHQGEIYLPDSHGPLNGPKAQALLAHEMTHVAQQRRLGSSLPHEASTEGRHLEAQAVEAETTHELPLAPAAEKSAASGTADSSEAPPSPDAELLGAPVALPAGQAQRAPSANDARWKDPDDAFRAQLDSNEDYLFDRFERRLRYVLIHERERGGTLVDAL